LIAATVKDMFEACGRYPIEGLPRLVDDLDGWIEGLPSRIDDLDDWLERLAVTVHTRTARIFGRAFWDIHAPNGKTSDALAELASLRRQYRLQGVGYLAALTWQTAGGTGEVPPAVMLAFALNLSAFTTQALMIDFDKTPAEVGVLTADILKAFVLRAVEAQRTVEDRDSADADGVG
jgi:hypothetical protein